MKLLIVTQVVDESDSILGFFHRWIEEFSKHYEKVIVICLRKGEYRLPDNVEILTLGKEDGGSKFKYLWRFYKYIWGERNNYDTVFVHMNQEYILLGGIFWRFWRKKILLWRNHRQGNWLTNTAVWLSDSVFCTSRNSFTAKFSKTKIMPVGVDTDFFRPDQSIVRVPQSILFLGRMSRVKNISILVDALNELQKRGVKFSVKIVGPTLSKDLVYEKMIKEKVLEYGMNDRVHFLGSVTKYEARKLYQESELYVNLTQSGSLDKTIFEAMACGCLVIVSNEDLADKIDGRLIIKSLDPFTIAESLTGALSLLEDERVKVIDQEMILSGANSLETLFKKFNSYER